MRFHVGFSFRLRDLKKFIFPILIGILAYFGFGGLFGCLNVYAYINTDTYFVFEVPEEDFSQQFYQDKTYKEVLDYYTNFESSYYNIMVWYSSSRNNLYLDIFSKNYELYKSTGSTIGSTFNSLYINGNNSSVNNSYHVVLNNRSSELFDNSLIQHINNCLVNNSCSDLSNSLGSFINYPTNQGVNYNLLSYDKVNLSNDMSYNLENVQIMTYLYYSQVPFYLRYTNISNNYYTKYLIINNNTYGNDSIFPSYLNLYGSQSLNKDYTSIDKIYISSIDKNDIINLKLDFSFTFNDINYIDSLNPNIQYFGRINNTTYYSYESIICNSSNLYSYSLNNNKYTGSLFNNSLSCSSDLSNFDKIYIYVQFNGVGNHLIQDLSIRSNYGYLKTFDNTINNFQIYERFTNLDYNYSFVLSSLSYESLVYYISSNVNTILSPINKSNNINNSGVYNPLKFGLFNSTNAFIYNMPDIDNSNYSIDLFFTDDIILSLSDSNNHTLYDDSNTLTNDNLIKNKNIDNNSSFDISYYMSIVSSFIDDLSLSTDKLGLLVQNFYDSLPLIFQSFIFVIFILFCLKFTLDLIRK